MPAVIFLPCLIPLAAQSLLCISKTVDAQTEIFLKQVAEKISKSMLGGSELQQLCYFVGWLEAHSMALQSTVLPAPAQLWVFRPFFQASLLGQTASSLCRPWRNHTKHPPSCVNVARGGKQPRHGEGEAHSVSDLSWALGMFQSSG